MQPEVNIISIPLTLFSEEEQFTLIGCSEEQLALMLYTGFRTVMPEPNFSSNPNPNPEPKSRIITKDRELPPTKIGEIGEEYVKDILASEYRVEDVSHLGHSGDLFVHRKPVLISELGLQQSLFGKLLVEVKKYRNPVPSHEVHKFLRDLREHSQISGGLFISLHSEIVGIPSHFHFQILTADRKLPTLYVCSSSPEVIRLAARVLWTYSDAMSDALGQAQGRIDKICRQVLKLSDATDSLAVARRTIDEVRATVNRQLQKAYNNMYRSELQISARIHKIQNILNCISYSEVNHGTVVNGTAAELVRSTLATLKSTIDCHLSKNKLLRKSLSSLLIDFLPPKVELEARLGDKFTIWYPGETGKKCIVKIELMKTKTKVSLCLVQNENSEIFVSIPCAIQYDRGWMNFVLDSTFVNNVLPGLEKFFLARKKEL
jgi:hypothetical protein